MVEKRSVGGTPPSAGGSRAPDGGARRVKQSDEDQRFGPLQLDRYVKDDGRALILYARAAEQRE
jgi:hypothetical protein